MTLLEQRLPNDPKTTNTTATQTDNLATYMGDHTYVESNTVDNNVQYMLIDSAVIPESSDLSENLEYIPNPEVSLEPAIASTLDEYNQLDID